jgi:hypothetical protein
MFHRISPTSASSIAAGSAFVLLDVATAHARRTATSELIDGYASPLGSVIFTVAVALALDGANSALVVDACRLGGAVVRRGAIERAHTTWVVLAAHALVVAIEVIRTTAADRQTLTPDLLARSRKNRYAVNENA